DQQASTSTGNGLPLATLRDYEAFRQGASTLRVLAAWSPAHAVLRGGPPAAPPQGQGPPPGSCNFFSGHEAKRSAGPVLRDADCSASAAVAVIGEGLWRRRYEADPNILGATIDLNDRPFTVVGVMPDRFDGQLRGPIWVPLTATPAFFAGRDLTRE